MKQEPSPATPSLLIISSAWNEEECLPEFFRRINLLVQKENSYNISVLMFDNGSSDNTWNIILENVTKSSFIRGVKFSRNFSLDAAFACGLDLADSDLVVVMASDLQDPPEVISDMLRKYESGSNQVLVRIKKRETVPWLRRNLSEIYYKIANVLTDGMLPENVSDFRLMSRKVYSQVRKLREQHRYFRGLAVWVGFDHDFIEIHRPPRYAGKSTWLSTKFLKVISNSLRNIYSFSSKPLALLSILGVVTSAIAFLSIAIYSVYLVSEGRPPFAGFGTLIGIIVLGFSLNVLALGFVAQYLGLIFDEVKKRPLYVIDYDSSEEQK